MISLVMAVALGAAPEAAYFHAWYPRPFADLKADPDEALLREAGQLASAGETQRAYDTLAALEKKASPEWKVIVELSRRRMRLLQSRNLDLGVATDCLECGAAYLEEARGELDFTALNAALAQTGSRQQRLGQLGQLAQVMAFTETGRGPMMATMLPALSQAAPALQDVPEAQLVTGLIFARGSARTPQGATAPDILETAATQLSGCARAWTLDEAAHLEQGWAGSLLTLGVEIEQGRLLTGPLRSGGVPPPIFTAPVLNHRLLDQADVALAGCPTADAALERQLHQAVLATRRNEPAAPGRWLAIAAEARKAGDSRSADMAALIQGLLRDSAPAVTGPLKALLARDDRAAFFSAVDLVLLWSELAWAQGDELRAELGWGALEAAFDASTDRWPWNGTAGMVHLRASESARTLGLSSRAVLEGERGIAAFERALAQCERISAPNDPTSRSYAESSCSLVVGGALNQLQGLSFSYGDGARAGALDQTKADARIAELIALEGRWRQTFPTTLAKMNPKPLPLADELQAEMTAWLAGGPPLCESNREIFKKTEKRLWQRDAVGAPVVAGLAFQLDQSLALCSAAEAAAARQRLRSASVQKARAELPPGPAQPWQLTLSMGRAMMFVTHALTLGDSATASEWLKLLEEIQSKGMPPSIQFSALKAQVSLAQGKVAEGLAAVSGWPRQAPQVTAVRLEAYSRQGNAEEALTAFDEYQQAVAVSVGARLGVDRRSPHSAERAALENVLARTGQLSAAAKKRLDYLRLAPELTARAEPRRFATTAEVKGWVNQLPEGWTVLALARMGPTLIGFRLERGAPIVMKRWLLPPGSVDPPIELMQYASAGLTDAEGPAVATWHLLLEPLGPIAPGRTVVLVAAPELAGVLFEAVHPPSKPALAITNPFLRASTLLEWNPEPASTGPVVAVGVDGQGLQRAAREVSQLKSVVPSANVMVSPVQRQSALDAVSAARWVHLAAHGRIDGQNPLASAIELSGGDSLKLYDFLASARGVDGEVFSACDTAVAGFSAFAHAGGSRTALATPWPIWDSHAEGMTRTLYNALGNDPSKWVDRLPLATQATRKFAMDELGLESESAAAAFLLSARSVTAVLPDRP